MAKEKKIITIDGEEVEVEVEMCKPSKRKAIHGKLTKARHQKKCAKYYESVEELMDRALEQLPEVDIT